MKLRLRKISKLEALRLGIVLLILAAGAAFCLYYSASQPIPHEETLKELILSGASAIAMAIVTLLASCVWFLNKKRLTWIGLVIMFGFPFAFSLIVHGKLLTARTAAIYTRNLLPGVLLMGALYLTHRFLRAK